MAMTDSLAWPTSGGTGQPPWFCPALSGQAIVDGTTLDVRLASDTLSVTAPPAYLQALVKWCDGTRLVNDILDALPETIDRGEFSEFIVFLTELKVIIDGNHLTAQALQYGRQLSPFGESAPRPITDGFARRHASSNFLDRSEDGELVESASWMEALNTRVSSHTFDDQQSVTASQLRALLWSLCGIIETSHPRLGVGLPRKTIASAGALYTIEALLLLQHAVGDHAPGIYRVRYPGPRRVALEKISDDSAILPRMFAEPWHTRYATGAVFLIADIQLAAAKYRNRAVQYLFSEAGAAMQNASLAAPQLGLGMTQLGCYHESTIEAAYGLDDKSIVGAAVFGVAPTVDQLESANTASVFDFTWKEAGDDLHYAMPGHLACAKLSHERSSDFAWGVDEDPGRASFKAFAESIERCGWRSPSRLQRGTAELITNACDVPMLTGYTASQYANPGFPFSPFALTREYWWVCGVDIAGGAPVHVPADLVYDHASLVAAGRADEAPLMWSTTSGCAAATSIEASVDRALFELVERDAFMRHWLTQRAGTRITSSSTPADLHSRIQLLQDAGCRVSVQWLPSQWGPVILATASHDEAGFTTLGAAAAEDPEHALRCALHELESRVFVVLNGLSAIDPIAPEAVRTPAHHFMLYAQREWYRHGQAFLMAETGDSANFNALCASLSRPSATLSSRMAAQGLKPFCVDITPLHSAIDQGRTHLTVARVFVPTLVPLTFGWGLEPRALADRVHPDSQFPHPFP